MKNILFCTLLFILFLSPCFFGNIVNAFFGFVLLVVLLIVTLISFINFTFVNPKNSIADLIAACTLGPFLILSFNELFINGDGITNASELFNCFNKELCMSILFILPFLYLLIRYNIEKKREPLNYTLTLAILYNVILYFITKQLHL